MHIDAGSDTHHNCNKVIVTEGSSSIPHSVTLLEGSCNNRDTVHAYLIRV